MQAMQAMQDVRIGFGEDAHRLAAGRALVLGGVTIDGAPRGAVAHSDGDALLHAITDALLSAWTLGDIGALFPDVDPAFAGADSALLLTRALAVIRAHAGAWQVGHVSAVVTLDRPKLGGWREAIAARIAALLDLAPERVGITFKTSEGLAPDHVQARAVVLWRAPVE
jgi:2-C-methyl-D-erythritol 2,4-cyclodiphosphate synthase